MDEYGEKTEEPPVISTYQHDHFVDLCRGPHLEHTGQIPPDAFKLLSVAGAYWRGDEHNPMLQRIYGTVWPNKAQLEAYLNRLEEAKRRDHRRLGKELDLFSTNPDEVGGGLVLWHPKGGLMRHLAEEFCKNEHLAGGYDLVYTPHIGRATLWETSGHLGFYKENMYAPIEIEGQEYYLKPMNCPFHITSTRRGTRSYRDLPLRYAEWGTVYRYERSGVLHGLMRVRGFTQDDAHIFCRPDQMPAEIDRVLALLPAHPARLRLHGVQRVSQHAARAPRGRGRAVGCGGAGAPGPLERAGLPYQVDEGGGAFYGPKIDLKIRDALGARVAVQHDPVRLQPARALRPGVHRRGRAGASAVHDPPRAARQHGALLRRADRALRRRVPGLAARCRRCSSRSPTGTWKLREQWPRSSRRAGLRVEVDGSAERMNAKIRDAQLQKIPYMLVVGDREAAEGAVTVRLRTGEQRGTLPVDEFIA